MQCLCARGGDWCFGFVFRPQVTIATAMMLCHRFYMRQSHAKNDWQVNGMLFFLLLFGPALLLMA